MRITLAAVGRMRRGPELALFEHYARRITWPHMVREIVPRRPLSGAALRDYEAELLLAACPPDAVLVAMDERGISLTSEQFAERLGDWRDTGNADAAFVIGGDAGLATVVRERATLVMSLGALTWPHMLVRALLAEQIYRAQQILAGHPYHRGN